MSGWTSGERCYACGRKRGLEQPRRSWGIHPTVYIPRTNDPADKPAQASNDLICSASVYRNGGANEGAHLCDLCLRIALRALKVALAETLDELDAEHDLHADLAAVTKELAHVQYAHYQACFEHDRMQERLRELLADNTDAEVVRMAEWEVARGPLRDKVKS